jgi:hypothetical protein
LLHYVCNVDPQKECSQEILRILLSDELYVDEYDGESDEEDSEDVEDIVDALLAIEVDVYPSQAVLTVVLVVVVLRTAQLDLLHGYIDDHEDVVDNIGEEELEVTVLELPPLIVQVHFDVIEVEDLQVVVLLHDVA